MKGDIMPSQMYVPPRPFTDINGREYPLQDIFGDEHASMELIEALLDELPRDARLRITKRLYDVYRGIRTAGSSMGRVE